MSSPVIKNVYIQLGSNLGNRKLSITKAKRLMENEIAKIQICSSYYETESWGDETLPSFINQVCMIRTSRKPLDILHIILDIEVRLGRIRSTPNMSRIIDIDILFFGKDIIKMAKLKIPHPRLHLRNFVLVPLLEIAPQFIHPTFKKTVSELYSECTDEKEVRVL